MPITLNDQPDFESSSPYTPRHPFTRVINSVRIYNIPALNFFIISVLGFFLIKLTTKYTGLYMKSSLITIIVTNLVLYGISETLAQSIVSYKPTLPRISFRYNDNSPSTRLSFNSSLDSSPETEDLSDVDDEGIERFINFLQQDHESRPTDFSVQPVPLELSYFQFNRLAGFMCWGFILAFVQCWWYKFLQIYSKDPKFIEVLRKVLTDQLCYSPVSLFCFFTYGTMVLESGTWDDAKVKLGKVYLKTLLLNFTIWFPVQFINFLMIPRNFQVPFSSSVSVLWNCFLSMKNSSSNSD